MNTKTIFAHESGDTFQMERSVVRVGRDRTAHARKPVALVTEATRKAERDYQDLWAFKGEFKTARSLVRSLGIAQDLTSPSAVY